MVTGRGSEEVAASVMKAGASDYIIKPFEKEQILTVVKDTLRIRQAEIKTRKLREELRILNKMLEVKVEERTRDLVMTQERLIHQQNLASLGEMSGGMAHEIRNPLNSISLYSEIMMDELPEEDPKREYLQKIMSDIDRINAIVTNLNLFSRRIKREKEPIHLQRPLESVLRTLSTQFVNKDINVSVEIESALPEVLASSEEMEEVFSHLLVNSINAMPKGGEIKVSMKRLKAQARPGPLADRPEKVRDYIEVSVRDTGIGIPKDDLPKIFIPFFTTKSDWQGTGLGLSVVHRVVNDHEGSIDVESEVGMGTTFTIRFPVLESGANFKAIHESAA
jgi:signal transduction histidine kinase